MMPSLRSWLVGAWVAFAVLGGCDDPTSPLPREGPPDELSFLYGGFGTDLVRIELHGASVAMWRRPWNWNPSVPVDTVRAVPTDAAWREFWIAAEQAGVRRWRSRYVTEGVVDGDGWTLLLVVGDFTILSSGSNAFPDSRGREHELEMTEEFRLFRAALGNLVGEEL